VKGEKFWLKRRDESLGSEYEIGGIDGVLDERALMREG